MRHYSLGGSGGGGGEVRANFIDERRRQSD